MRTPPNMNKRVIFIFIFLYSFEALGPELTETEEMLIIISRVDVFLEI
jgi:hypothetical protein